MLIADFALKSTSTGGPFKVFFYHQPSTKNQSNRQNLQNPPVVPPHPCWGLGPPVEELLLQKRLGCDFSLPLRNAWSLGFPLMRSFEPTTVWVLHTGRSEPDRERGARSTGVWILENTCSQVTDSTPPSRPSWWMMTTRSLPAPRTKRPGVKTEDGLCSREKSSANFTMTFGKCLWTLLAEFGGFCLFWSKSLVHNDDVGGCETVSVTFDLWIYFCVRVNLPPRPRAVSLEFSVCKNWRRISILLRNQSTSKISFWKAKLWLPWSALAPPRGGTSALRPKNVDPNSLRAEQILQLFKLN